MPDGCGRIDAILARAGLRAWAGVDEAGRGAAAGPLVVAAVLLDDPVQITGLRDSKLIAPAARERIYDEIIDRATAVAVVVLGPAEVDERGVHRANLEGMRRAVARLPVDPELALMDGFTPSGIPLPTVGIWKGDRVSLMVAAASVVAKVVRDRIMIDAARIEPQYGFDRHKGYLTALHRDRLKRFGPCGLHRRSFEPVGRLLSSA